MVTKIVIFFGDFRILMSLQPFEFYYKKQSGAVEAYWAHSPEVRGSNPGRALPFRMDLQKIDALRDRLLSIKEKLSSNRFVFCNT